MIKPLIEFCIGNLVNGSQKVFEELKRDPNLDVIEYGCMSYCGICESTLFAVVNGEIVKGSTAEELTNNIYQYLDDNPMF
ncbi:YuzB family protein [Bacillus sp. DNRA2]|uniref:YuzB family protein n=1 Tax=Bacillus sp. DNRA2 TaxID=2723053 RepID=UPI00145E4B27|nr:YuzB family protein [Bacillus sp. DNRA2]NMD69023.1 YuzB family protein [Bacillus sp. DNRA2]